ncbi:hypothetical protein PG984_003504 [Apiospora sp. TS-2023a]
MRTAFFTALALGGLVANTIASPVEAPAVQQSDLNITLEFQGYGDGDYNSQGNILELLLEEIEEHADIIDADQGKPFGMNTESILGEVSGKPGWGGALKLIRKIAPQLGAVAELLNGLDIVGKQKSPYVVAQDDVTGLEHMVVADVEVEEMAGGYGSGRKPQCNKLCVFDLCTKILLQVYGILFGVVSKCGLGFSFQYLSPIVLKLVKKLTMLDMVVGGVSEACQPLIGKILGTIRLAH